MSAARTRQSSTTRSRGPRRSPRQLSRAERQALEARAANTLAPRSVASDHEATAASAPAIVPSTVTATRPRRETVSRRRLEARPLAIPREQEYRFIRADLRRLLATASVLLVVMLLLLLLVD